VIAAPTQIGKILYAKRDYENGVELGIFTANFDGTGETKININGLPTNGTDIDMDNLTVSPDGKTLFFTYSVGNGNGHSVITLYSCNIDGTGLKIVKGGGNNTTGYVLEQVF
jgi:Tol biopolymer transport system component